MRPDVARADVRLWVTALLPLLLLGGLLGVIVWSGPADAVRDDDLPAIERVAFQRVTLGPEGITAVVLNDGPDPVTIAQVVVDEAYWRFDAKPSRLLRHLERATLTIPYPWVRGEAHQLRLVTATGATFDHEIAVAVATPRPGWRFFATFTLIGLYVGVIPVAIGLLWYPMVTRVGRSGLDFLLALTVGLLVFLLVDAVHEGLEAAEGVPGSFQGAAVLLFGAAGSYLMLEAFGHWLCTRRGEAADAGASGWTLALLVAVGIGLHNFGEGLAIGAAFALGEVALGSLLIVGFALHNTTEGLAIVAPLSRVRARLGDLVHLGLVGGVPTIGGAWLGGLLHSPVLSVLFLAVGAGAIAQVAVQVTRQMAGERPVVEHVGSGPVMAGLFTGVLVMYVTGMLVG